MGEIGIGIVGGGYMGKAHAVAMSAVGAVFDTGLRPRLEMVAAGSLADSAERYRDAYGFQARRARLAGARARPAGRGRHHRLAAIHPPRHCRRRLRAWQAGTLRKAAWAQAWTTAAPWSKRRTRAARPTWSASTISAPRPAGSPANLSPRAQSATSPGFAASTPRISRRPAWLPGQLAHRRRCQRHHGRSRPAHDQRSACARWPDRERDGRDRNRAREPGPAARWQ
jgi:hypothetical protein